MMSPLSGMSRPTMWRSETLLPVPDGPMRTVTPFLGMRQVTPSRTRNEPKALWTSTISMIGSMFHVASDWLVPSWL